MELGVREAAQGLIEVVNLGGDRPVTVYVRIHVAASPLIVKLLTIAVRHGGRNVGTGREGISTPVPAGERTSPPPF
jgi:hypothetical protein